MEEREFHLCREPWIYVMEQDYQVKEVTLIDALVNADKYRVSFGSIAYCFFASE